MTIQNLFFNHKKIVQFLKLIFSIVIIFSLNYQSIQAEEYLWAGANQYQLWFQRQGRIYQQLNAMQDAGLKVLRIFLGHRGYTSWEDPPEAYTFEDPIGTFNEANLEKVDYLMDECLKRGIKLIIALNNHSDNYLDKYGATGMYSNPDAIADYKNRFNYFLNHYNSYLQKQWKDCDEVVYAWEIQNEPGIPLINVSGLTSTQRHDIMRNYLSELSTYLKSIDPNTKVSLGIAGYANYYHSGKSGDDIRTLGNIEDADIYTLHFYSQANELNRWIDDNLSYCRSINKLLFIEEFGKTRDAGMTATTSHYSDVAKICRTKGVPWMFWRLGHRKDQTCWCINSDDSIWDDVIIPETQKINQVKTSDPWGINPITPVAEGQEKLESYDLVSCYPNPFNQSIKILIQMNSIHTTLRILNVRGQEVYRDEISDSRHSINYRWDGTDNSGNQLSSGVYFLVVQGEKNRIFEKIYLMK